MGKINTAIILNAGEGKRLRPLTSNTPKCLLNVGSKKIIDHQLSNLCACGIDNVIMVVGYKSELIKQFSANYPNINFTFITNEQYFSSNTIYSLWLALKGYSNPFILLNGDVVFQFEVLNSLIKAPYKTCLAINVHKLGEEEVKVKLNKNTVVSIGKNLNPLECDGEFVGIAKFLQPAVIHSFRQELKKMVDLGEFNHYFEFALTSLLGKGSVYAVDTSAYKCIEIDTKEDLESLLSIFLN